MNKNLKKTLDQILVGVIIVVLWQLGSLKYGEFWLGSPLGVVERGWEWLATGDLIRHSGYTLEEAFIGFVLGAVPGAVIPFLLRRRPILNAILDPYIVGGYALPKLALTPLLIIWFGIGIWSKVVLVIGLTFFIVLFNTQSGIRGVSPQLIRMGEILGADESKVARSIVWPSALPHIFAGIRIAVPFSIGAAAIAEILSANRGLGYLITASSNKFDATGAFTAIVALTILVALINLVINRLEQTLLGWRPTTFGEKQESTAS